MLQENNYNNMLSASNLNEKSILSVITILIVCCALHKKFVIKKKKTVFKQHQMTYCCYHHCFVHCNWHKFSNNPWNNMGMTMANMLVSMRGENFIEYQNYHFFLSDQTTNARTLTFSLDFAHVQNIISHWLSLSSTIFILSAWNY